jgi:hypothetical protein
VQHLAKASRAGLGPGLFHALIRKALRFIPSTHSGGRLACDRPPWEEARMVDAEAFP